MSALFLLNRDVYKRQLVSCLSEHGSHSLGIVLVYLASQSRKCHSSQKTFPLLIKEMCIRDSENGRVEPQCEEEYLDSFEELPHSHQFGQFHHWKRKTLHPCSPEYGNTCRHNRGHYHHGQYYPCLLYTSAGGPSKVVFRLHRVYGFDVVPGDLDYLPRLYVPDPLGPYGV